MVFSKLRAAAAASLLALLSPLSPAATAAVAGPNWVRSCTLLVEHTSGQALRRDGGDDCAQRLSPFSTFKLPLALMGYDAGILTDEHAPRWDYKPEFNGYARQRHATDPSNWQSESIVWYSQQLTRQLGAPRFAAYVARLGYGNRDVRGGPGRSDDGLTHAWLGSSLAVSADEQASFLRRLLKDELPVSPRAMALTRAIAPAFAAADGWLVHGKTGSGWLRDRHGKPDHQRPLGWFVGWAEKDGRRIVFARMALGSREQDEGLGLTLRAAFLKDLPALLAAQPANAAAATATLVAPASTAKADTGQEASSGCAGDGWTDPAPARRIHGNTWYVGSCGLSSILVTSPAGHVLLDGGTRDGAAQVRSGIRQLGFKVEDVRYILNGHAHFDHAGGIAQLQQASGATVVARGADADALERGGGDRTDPQFLSADKFSPVPGVRRVRDGETVALGGTAITAHATPGHTPGSTSWSWTSCDTTGQCLRMVYADSITAYTDDAYRYSDEASHPGVLAAFRTSLATVAALPCDVLMTPHPSASRLLQRLDGTGDLRLVDSGACQRYAAQAARRLDEFVAKEGSTKR